jgi:hypothetical protein
MSVVGILLGIFGIIFGWFPIIQYAALGLSVSGIILSALGLKKSGKTGKGQGAAIAGLILCIFGTIGSGIGVFVCTAATSSALSKTPEALEDLKNAANALEGAKDVLDSLK